MLRAEDSYVETEARVRELESQVFFHHFVCMIKAFSWKFQAFILVIFLELLFYYFDWSKTVM